MPSEKAIEAAAEKICCPGGCTRKPDHGPCIAYTVVDVTRAAILVYERERGISEAEVEAAADAIGSLRATARAALTAAQAVRVKEIEG